MILKKKSMSLKNKHNTLKIIGIPKTHCACNKKETKIKYEFSTKKKSKENFCEPGYRVVSGAYVF